MPMPMPVKLPVGYRNPTSIGELITYCNSKSHVEYLDLYNRVMRLKINGRVRIWKHDPSHVEIPVKYGLYTYGTLTADDIARVLIPHPIESVIEHAIRR